VVFVLASAGRLTEHTTFIAARDLLNGTAHQYHLDTKERHKLLLDDSIKQAEVPPLSAASELLVHPELSPLEIITTEKDYWTNRAVAEFYQKEYVVIVLGP
jgi:hypothetical protein